MENNIERTEDKKDINYDEIKTNKLYTVMAYIFIIWGVIVLCMGIYKAITNYETYTQYFGEAMIDILTYGIQFVGAFVPGWLALKWRKEGLSRVTLSMVISLVAFGILTITSLGWAVLIYGLPEALFVIGAVKQRNIIKAVHRA